VVVEVEIVGGGSWWRLGACWGEVKVAAWRGESTAARDAGTAKYGDTSIMYGKLCLEIPRESNAALENTRKNPLSHTAMCFLSS
jgi:hypothetical protein